MEAYPQLISQLDNSVIVINNSTFSIGRSLSCDHTAQSLNVSRFHCFIKKSNDKWIICDRSTNGTVVNSKLYTFNNSTHLKDGDIIKLGTSNVSFIFRTMPPEQNSEKLDATKEPSSSHSSVFPDDDDVAEQAAALMADHIEQTQLRSENNEESPSPSSSATVDKTGPPNELNLDVIDEELTCSICSELFIKAMTLNCSHTFCQQCINTWKKNHFKCPICRKRILTTNPTLVLDNFIDKIINTRSEEVKATRQRVVKDREEATVTAASSSWHHHQVIELDEDSDNTDSDDYYQDRDPYEYGIGGRTAPYYGGYGNCFICDEPGHWANSCPLK